MQLIIPKNRGFCYGVSLAVSAVEELLNNGNNPILFGELVHNPTVNENLIKRGANIVSDVDEIAAIRQENSSIIIRAHGLPKKTCEQLEETSANIIDKTCPKVKKVHDIVRRADRANKEIIVIGNSRHPEVIGIVGQCDNGAVVISSPTEAENYRNIGPAVVVSQTTFNSELFKEIVKVFDNADNIEVYNTICPATETRQKEINILSANADSVVVIGGKKSSNSIKLYEIAKTHCKAYIIESPEEVCEINFSGNEKILLCGGSSTPIELISSAVDFLVRKYSKCEIIYL